MLHDLRTALGFLTVLPVGPRRVEAGDLGNAVRYFPVVGAIYGILTWVFLNLGSRIFSLEITAWLTVFLLAFLNGCIHWDGFADMADGLGGRDPEKSRAIMKDSRLGAFGGIALNFLILGKVLALIKLAALPLTVLICISTLSRWAVSVWIYTQPVVSQGLLQSFRIANHRRDLLLATFLTLLLISPAFPVSLYLSGLTLVILVVFSKLTRRRFGGITGDLLGAGNELVELICLLSLNIKF